MRSQIRYPSQQSNHSYLPRESLATKAVRSPAGHSLSLESTTSSLALLAPAGVDITSQSGHVNIQVRTMAWSLRCVMGVMCYCRLTGT